MTPGAKVHKVSSWRQLQYLLKAYLPGTLCGLALIGVLLFLVIIGPRMYFRDIQGKPSQQGKGMVAWINYGVTDQNGLPSSDEVFIKMDNATVPDIYHNTTKRLQKGQPVWVTYRTGKSGRVYIEDVKPMEEAKL